MDDYGLTISDDDDECNDSLMSSAQHSVRSRKRATDGSLKREVRITGAGARMELLQGVARDLFQRTATPVAQTPAFRRTPQEIMNEARFEAGDKREALEKTLRNSKRVVSGGVRRVIKAPVEIEYWEQLLACEIYRFVQDLPSPWTTERVMAASGDKFPHLDQCTFKAMVATVIVSMRNTVQELLMGGIRQGAPMPETVAVHFSGTKS